MRYWLTPSQDKDPDWTLKITDVCEVYAQAPARHEAGERSVAVDEKTGIQALERNAPDLGVKPGKVCRLEFEYTRHGTQALIGGLDVATGKILAMVSDRRTEEDFGRFLKQLLDSDPQAKRWHIVCDNLNTHCSETLVCLVAEQCGIEPQGLGIKGRCGVMKSMRTRQKFLSDTSHKIVFHYTPKHASWLNQIEIWFSMLAKKLLRRGNFTSVEDLRRKLQEFIDYFNSTMARPFRWTYQGKVLAA